jgi:hypothetical protein
MLSSACSSSSNPAGPSDNPPQTSSTAGLTGGIRVTVNPNPVPFDGKPITDVAGCERRNNTWYYEMTLEETGGVPVTFHSQIDAFDGFVVNNLTGLRVNVPANGKVVMNPRWCSATNSKHTAQHTFTGNDANGNPVTLQSPLINLMAP